MGHVRATQSNMQKATQTSLLHAAQHEPKIGHVRATQSNVQKRRRRRFCTGPNMSIKSAKMG
eukprot:10828342-Karenia_brevis.AAC.1